MSGDIVTTVGYDSEDLITEQYPPTAAEIDFTTAREDHGSLWELAVEKDPEITTGDRDDLFLVEGGTTLHNCCLANVDAIGDYSDPYFGWCSCKQYEALDICIHLMVVRQASVVGGASIPAIEP
jgi:hypothetical protein